MSRRTLVSFVLAALAGGLIVPAASAQMESGAAKSTRKKLQQTMSVDAKEVGTADFVKDINNEIDMPIKFFIDNGSGVSNNSKVSLKLKDATVEKVLNELSDKMDFGWFVESNVGNNAKDGRIVIRKSTKGKERGYEAGKEPKKKASAPIEEPRQQPATPIVEAARRPDVLISRRD
jgi:hypothetical protein